MLLDIHTHCLSTPAGESIINIEPALSLFIPACGCYYSVGIHPWKATQADECAWQHLVRALHHPAVLAVGEAGLDKLASASMSLQEEVFARQIRLSEEMQKPLIIHCVKAFNELVLLKRKYRPQMPWVIHGFRNKPHIARQLLQEGIFLSLGEKYHPEVPSLLPPDYLLTETDESTCDIHTLIHRMADTLGTDYTTLCRQIDENTRNIFFRQ